MILAQLATLGLSTSSGSILQSNTRLSRDKLDPRVPEPHSDVSGPPATQQLHSHGSSFSTSNVNIHMNWRGECDLISCSVSFTKTLDLYSYGCEIRPFVSCILGVVAEAPNEVISSTAPPKSPKMLRFPQSLHSTVGFLFISVHLNFSNFSSHQIAPKSPSQSFLNQEPVCTPP